MNSLIPIYCEQWFSDKGKKLETPEYYVFTVDYVGEIARP